MYQASRGKRKESKESSKESEGSTSVSVENGRADAGRDGGARLWRPKPNSQQEG